MLSVSALLLSHTSLHAQLIGGHWETAWRFDGVSLSERLGHAVAGAGDVDGDGYDDVIVGAINARPSGSQVGSAFVYSGATGTLIWRIDGQANGDRLGSSVASAGDVDGDGFDDIILGAVWADPGGRSKAGSAYIHSGATGNLIWQLDGQAAGDELGFSVSGVGDVDGDGLDDVIIGARWADPAGLPSAGSAYVCSGLTGTLIRRFDGHAAGDALGSSVSGAGDVDGDGVDDVIVGAMDADPGQATDAGSAYVLSGATGALIWQFNGLSADDNLGIAVSGAGDVDCDGLQDLIVGASGSGIGGFPSGGSAYVYAGATGTVIWQVHGQGWSDLLGSSVSDAGDVDGDGVGDVIVGAHWADPGGLSRAGSAYTFSGATGILLGQFHGQSASDWLGFSVSGAGDVNGDGLDDLIVGAAWADPGGQPSAGSAFVYSLAPYLHLDDTELSISGGASVQFGLDFPSSEAGARYAVLASVTGTGPTVMGGLKIPLTQDHVLNMFVGGEVPPVLQCAFGTLNANSRAQAILSAGPALAPAIGQTVYFAAVTYDVQPLVGRMSSVARHLSIVQ